ncbi:MAG: LytR/AlgR family response regulator transcription factor [Crocinitomicaceae bacterium]
MKNSIYVVEDMAMTRASIISVLQGNGFEVTGSSAKASVAWSEIQENTPDLVLIDIHLIGEKDGIWLAEKIRANLSIPFIYLTAYGDPQTLMEVSRTEPDSYLLKPFNAPTLITNIRIALKRYNSITSKKQEESHSKVLLKEGRKQISLEIDQIHYLMSNGNYVEVMTSSRRYVIREKISVLIEQISHSDFIQVHRRYVVNFANIKAINSNRIWVSEFEIPVSSTFKKGLHERIEEAMKR